MRNNSAGATLIEVMVSVVLIAITSVTAGQFLSYCANLNMRADARVAAANYARETMERFYKRSYTDAALTQTDWTDDQLPTEGALGRLRDRYGTSDPNSMRQYKIENNTDAVTNTDYKLITVTVTWNQ